MSISSVNVAGIDFVLYVIEDTVIAVGDDGMALFLELIKVIDHLATEESTTVLDGRLIDDNLRSLCLDALHNALYARLAEVVAV